MLWPLPSAWVNSTQPYQVTLALSVSIAPYTVPPAQSCAWIPWWFLFVFIHLSFCMWCSVCICGGPCVCVVVHMGVFVYICLCVWVCVHGEARNWCRAFPSTSPHPSFWDNAIHCTVGHRFRYTGWPVNPRKLLAQSLLLKGCRCLRFCQAFYMSAGGSISSPLTFLATISLLNRTDKFLWCWIKITRTKK